MAGVVTVRGGARRGQRAGWHSEPCTASFPVGANRGDGSLVRVVCGKPQKWQGDRRGGHGLHRKHRWAGVLGGVQVDIEWWDP